MSYKHKGKETKYSDSESYLEVNARLRKGRYIYTNQRCERGHKPRRRKYKPYEEIYGELKKIKAPMFNEEVEEGEGAKAWLSGMNKYFQIYNCYDRLKSWMAIYNLIGEAGI